MSKETTPGLLQDFLELIATTREIVRAENAHARGGENSMRDACDFALCRMLEAWPASRLDALRKGVTAWNTRPAPTSSNVSEALKVARDFIDKEPELSAHNCSGATCEACKRRTQAFITVNNALQAALATQEQPDHVGEIVEGLGKLSLTENDRFARGYNKALRDATEAIQRGDHLPTTDRD